MRQSHRATTHRTMICTRTPRSLQQKVKLFILFILIIIIIVVLCCFSPLAFTQECLHCITGRHSCSVAFYFGHSSQEGTKTCYTHDSFTYISSDKLLFAM